MATRAEREKLLLKRFVLIGGTCYPEATFLASFNTVTLEKIEAAIPRAGTERTMFRAVAGLKTKNFHGVILEEALRRVVAAGGGLTREEVTNKGLQLVAQFPAPPSQADLDNKNSPS